MYYGRYSQEARRWVTSWPLPSELITHAKTAPALKIETPLRVVYDEDSAEALDENTPVNKAATE
jgi:hypothetical protein